MHLLALHAFAQSHHQIASAASLLLQDSSSGFTPEQGRQFGAAMAGMMGIFMLIGFAFMAFFVFLFWRILSKAGFAGPLALLALFPGIGSLIVLCILAFGDWKVVPAPQQAYYPPQYPPQYPPPPPTQL